jgi:hypothetical protein
MALATAAALAATPPGAALLLLLLGLAAVAAVLWQTDAASWLAAAWLRRRLQALQRRGGCALSVASTRSGVVVRGFDLDAAALPDGAVPVAVARLLVPEAELRWAGWAAPLRLRAVGVRLELLQRQAPQVGVGRVSGFQRRRSRSSPCGLAGSGCHGWYIRSAGLVCAWECVYGGMGDGRR